MTADDLRALTTPQLPEGDAIISTGPLLGLGDHLVYSTLAKRFKALGYRVLLDKDMRASNPEIADLVWGHNADIDDVTDRKPNCGYARQGAFYLIANTLGGHRSIEAMERAHGLPPPYSLAPKLYYEPRPTKITREDLARTVLVDYSAVSSTLTLQDIHDELEHAKARFAGCAFLQLIPPKGASVHAPQVGMASYQLSSIYEYVDMLAGCRAWIGSESGGQSLAAAVRGEHPVEEDGARPEIVCKITPKTHNSRGYCYRGVDYRDVGGYWAPLEVQTYQYEIQCKVRGVEMARRG